MAQHIAIYRSLLRELRRDSVSGKKYDRALGASFRAMLDTYRQSNNEQLLHDLHNAANFLQAQRTHKTLLERYNPTSQMTTEERVEATARRVGLNVPLSR